MQFLSLWDPNWDDDKAADQVTMAFTCRSTCSDKLDCNAAERVLALFILYDEHRITITEKSVAVSNRFSVGFADQVDPCHSTDKDKWSAAG